MKFLKGLKDSYWENYRKQNPAVRNLDKIDLAARAKDGGADLFIFTDENSLDASPNTQGLLREKVENYLTYINSLDFKNKFEGAAKNNTNIIIDFKVDPESTLLEFIRSMIPRVQECNANIKVEIEKRLLDEF